MKTLKLANLVALFGFAALAVQPASAKDWTYYAAGAEGNPTTVACITDGNWVLQVNNATKPTAQTAAILIGNGSSLCVKAGSGVLDLRGLTIDGIVLPLRLGGWDGSSAFKGCLDITEFYADNVAKIGGNLFQSCTALTTVSISGTFSGIPELTFAACTSLKKVVMNSPEFKTIWDRSFQQCKKLESIEITTDNVVTVHQMAMGQTGHPSLQVSLPSLTVNGPTWATGDLDYLLRYTSESDADKVCTIYANKDTWSSLASAVTDTEAEYKPKKCFGVYREGLRKAWLVANNADPVPFRIIIR